MGLSESDFQALSKARAKRWRKFEKLTNTPAARARREQMEKEFSEAEPMSYPEPVLNQENNEETPK
jgi:hypothetical protein